MTTIPRFNEVSLTAGGAPAGGGTRPAPNEPNTYDGEEPF